MSTRMLSPVRLTLLLVATASSSPAQQFAKPPAIDGATAQSQGSASTSLANSSRATILPVHRFWDRENDLLFAGVAAGRALDYASTLNLRHRGLDEIFLTNSIVDNHPLFAGIETGATATSIGVAYLFHRTGHHRLERWTSVVHIGVAVGGAARNYALKTAH